MQELRKILREGETILWESRPREFSLLEGSDKTKILIQWIFSIVFAVWFLYVERNDPNFTTGVKAMAALVAVVLIAAPVVEFYHLKRQRYYLTNQRVVLVDADKSVYYMDYAAIDEAAVITTQGKCIAVGGIIMENVHKQLRWQACHPRMDLQESDKRGEAMGLLLYFPEEVEKAVQLMRTHGIKLAG